MAAFDSAPGFAAVDSVYSGQSGAVSYPSGTAYNQPSVADIVARLWPAVNTPSN
jgi:hypothetical protein